MVFGYEMVTYTVILSQFISLLFYMMNTLSICRRIVVPISSSWIPDSIPGDQCRMDVIRG